jgi:hypothetical protein
MALQLNNGVTNELAKFDGAGSPVCAGGADAWTMAAWVYRDSGAGTSQFPLSLSADYSGGTDMIAFRHVAANNYTVYKFGDADYTLTAAAGSWIYLAFTMSASGFTGTGYHGTTTTLTSVSGPVATTAALDSITVGCWPSTGDPFKGRIAHIRFWEAELSEAELESEMVSATAVRTSNLYAAYEFANDSGTYLNDSSANARHLTGTNLDFATNYIAGPISSSPSVVPGIWLSRQNRAFGSARQRYT